MGWKDWNYKKRISFIFLFVDLFLILIMFPFYMKHTVDTTGSMLLKIILIGIISLGVAYPLSFKFYGIMKVWTGCESSGQSCMKEAVFGTLGGIFVALLIYFLAGWIIGLIVDRIRKSKIEKLAIEPMQPVSQMQTTPRVQQTQSQSSVVVETVKKEEIVRRKV